MIDRHLLALLPPLRRARGDRLYAADDRIWLDFWKDGGAWFFGHRPEGAAHEWKNQLDKGLGCLIPSRWPERLLAPLKQLIPDCQAVFLYRNPERARQALAQASGLTWSFTDEQAALWRPGVEAPTPAARPAFQGIRIPRLPTGPAQAFVVVLTTAAGDWPLESDLVAPLEAAAVVQAAHRLLERWPREAAARAALGLQLDSQVPTAGLFQRTGPYWQYIGAPEGYDRVFQIFFDHGILLSPDPDEWSILPLELSAGHIQALARAVAAVRVEAEAWNS